MVSGILFLDKKSIKINFVLVVVVEKKTFLNFKKKKRTKETCEHSAKVLNKNNKNV
jgi:hypothetical protein